MRPIRVAAAFAALISTALPAQAWTARNGMAVEPLSPSSFSVAWTGRAGARNFWCAAGDYVTRNLTLPPATKIYRYSPPIRQSGEGIVFGLDPARATATGLIRLQGGLGVTAAHARLLCERPQDD
ncbi:hypothetical protein E2L08_01695 [Palleronia sediminis]|uniref:Uncharacterized protein n=1 Tax=Palleronia sediminis TaxID=2547833 RepID=A0A4R6ALR3_9RHOB|nr:hypothetical protein [Palleronia sediminis]TDL84204.1 hypothetical protein E2L08_01695 [Palleronia sediminis]